VKISPSISSSKHRNPINQPIMSLYATIEKQQQEIEAILKERIDLAQKERTSIREVITTIDNKIKTTSAQFATIGGQDKRPRETIEQINASISEMEYLHATTSQSKAQERELLKNLEKLKQKKKALAQYNVIQAEVDELKAKRATIAAELKGKDEGLDELHLGLRRVRTAMTLHVGISEVVSYVYAVPEDRLPQVIGKGGSNLKQIETDYGVSIESERYGSNELNILGTPQAIQLAVQSIDTVVNTVAEEFTISEQAIVCLTLDKGSLLQELQTRYSVRIEANRSKRYCKIVGLQSIVDIAKKEILGLQAVREEIPIDLSTLPSIVGKGGVVVRGIGEENHVHIDINRDDSKIIVMGLRDGVTKAAASIRAIADENKEVEEAIQIEKQIMIGCVIGPNGTTIRNIQTTFNVSLRTEKGTSIDTLHIVGTTARVLAAKQHVLELIKEYSNNSELIAVPADCMPIILGKKGSRINALREEHSTVNIDVDDNSIRICGGTAEGRAKAKAVIADILASNWMVNMPCETDLGILLKSTKGLEVRQQLLSTFNLSVDIDTEHAVIKLRGYREKVEKGVALINNFLEGFHTIVIELSDEDCASLMNGSSPGTEKAESSTATPMTSTATTTAAAVAAATAVASTTISSPESYVFSPTKYVEVKYGVEVHINRKECRLRLRGALSAIQAAQANIYGILNGDPAYGAVLVPIDPLLYATLIGKAGSNLKKMEADLNVKLDILKSRSLLRIRGSVESVMPAKSYIIDFMDNVRASTNVTIPNHVSSKEIDRIIDIFKSLYVDAKFITNLQASPKVVTIRGSLLLIEEAKVLMEEHFVNQSTYIIHLPMQYTETHRFERAWKKIRDACSVELNVVASASSTASIPRSEVKLQGTVENVSKAKKLLYDALMTILPASTFVAIYMTADQLKTISLQKHIRDINTISGLEDLVVDRPLSCLRLMSSHPESVAQAAHIVQQKIISFERGHVGVGPVDGAYVWTMLVGKNNEHLSVLEKQLNVSSISFNRSTLMIDFECKDESNIKTAISILGEKLDKIRSEHYEVELDEAMVRAVIGKQGANIAKFRAELQATIDLDYNVLKVN
jgi:polyribonucleotide nucleotidyltransferase